MLGSACFLLTAGTARRVAAWAALALALTLFIWRFGAGLPAATRSVWLAGVAGVVVLHRLKVAARWGASVATAALALVVVYCVALAFAHARALNDSEREAAGLAQGGEKVLRVAAMPTAADPFAWRCVADTDRSTFRFDINLSVRRGEGADDFFRIEKPSGDEQELVRRASADARARVLLNFARFPVARVARDESGRAVVRFADLRFTEPGARTRVGGFALDVEVPTK
jgi:hypothetical protein